MNKKDIRKIRTAVKNFKGFNMGNPESCVIGIGLKLRGERVRHNDLSVPLIEKFAQLYRVPRQLVYDIYWCKAVSQMEGDTPQEKAVNLLTNLIEEGIPTRYL